MVYIAPTTFFNNTSSSKYSKFLSDVFGKSNYFYLTDNAELADYVINAKVLRAKVDPINKDTNRMQMVIALESKNVNSGETETEHQNRFLLFNASENEQTVAQKLMKQLFEKACDKIITKSDIEVRKKTNAAGLPSVITPAAAPQLKKDVH